MLVDESCSLNAGFKSVSVIAHCFLAIGSTTNNCVLCPALLNDAQGCLRCKPSKRPPMINHFPSA